MDREQLISIMAAIIYAGEEGVDPTTAVKDAYELSEQVKVQAAHQRVTGVMERLHG